MDARESSVNPFLQGNFAPWRMEGEAPDLEVVGELPRELRGTYFRNGPNPAFEPIGRYHWFDGDGMIHAIRIADGRAHYRNRWVASEGLVEERAAGHALYPGLLEFGRMEVPRFQITRRISSSLEVGSGTSLGGIGAILHEDFRHSETQIGLSEWTYGPPRESWPQLMMT